MDAIKIKINLLVLVLGFILAFTGAALIAKPAGAASILPQTVAQESGNFEGRCQDDNISKENCGIVAYLVTLVNILSALVGVIVVIMIAVGGVQYTSARDNPQAAAAAKGRITNAVIALVLYLLVFSFLQWLVPGGVL